MKTLKHYRQSVVNELKAQDIEIKVEQLGKLPAILSRIERVKNTTEPTPPVEVPPAYFVRPEKYKTPHIVMWKRWLEAKGKGITFSLNGVISTLCICCGIPVACSESDKTRIGSRGKFSHETGRGNYITVGAVVTWDEEVEIENPYTFEIEETEIQVFRLVTVSGLGCSACRREYLKRVADSISQNRVREAEYAHRLATVKQLQTLYTTAAINAGETVNQSIVESFGLGIAEPKPVTAYILINPKQIDPETTLNYWRERADKLEPIALTSPSVPTQVTTPPMGFLIECRVCGLKYHDYKNHKCKPSMKKTETEYDPRFSLLNPNRFKV